MSYSIRPNILLIGNFLSLTGGSRGVCEDLAPRLEAIGYRVLTASDKKARLPRLLHMVQTAWKYRQNYDVALVDVYSGLAFLWTEAVCLVLRQARKPYILTLRGGNLPSFAQRWSGRVRTLLGSAAAVTTPSCYLQEQMHKYRADLRLLPNPLDLSAYQFRKRSHPLPHLVWLRAFHALYNPSLAARVVALLRVSFPDIRLTMVGPDKEDGSLQTFQRVATDLDVTACIRLTGGIPKSEVPVALQQGDIFLNTTNVDNTPVSIIEAIACGLCVVSTNVGGIPYLLDDEQDALLVPPDDPDAMAAAVARLLTEPGLAERLSHNARRKVVQFDWSVVLPQWQMLLETVAECDARN